MSSSKINTEKPFIPLKDILLATENFGPEATITDDGFGVFYHGQLSESWQNREALVRRFHDKAKQRFRNEVEIMSKFNHENILSLIGYCDEANEMIAVFECPSKPSLYSHLDDEEDLPSWEERLKICLGIARGLECLHSGLVDYRTVFHAGMIMSANIFFDDNMEAKFVPFDLSSILDADKDVAGSNFYLDPIYKESGVLNTEADVYSFGIILFELVTGMLASAQRVIAGVAQPQRLINLVRRYSHEDRMEKLAVDPRMQEHRYIGVARGLREIALQCISWDLKDRPKMKTIVKMIQEAMEYDNKEDVGKRYLPENVGDLEIPKEEIMFAIESSPDTCIGSGGLATVYKGQWHDRIVAIKRLNSPTDQRLEKFCAEIMMVSRFHHQNVIGLVGFCLERDEDVMMVCDYASNGSLDRHLQDPDKRSCITWAQRLKICLGVARGLEYLHSGIGEVTVIHRGIKSENILLDHNLEAKICGFGSSLLVAWDQLQVYHLLEDTSNYMDPIYSESGIVTAELDVYAFGVVMLEMLSGTLAYKPTDDKPHTLTQMVRRYYDDDEPDIMVDPLIGDQISNHSFHVFAKIAYRCISYNLEDRPTMKWIVRRIEEALESQTRKNMAEASASIVLTRSPQHQGLERFRIPLNDINYTPDREHRVGDGGFGKVYKGRLSEDLWKGIVAIKCLDPEGHQGKKEFLTEVELISSFHHPNIIPFVGYCDEGDQMIMVSEYAVNGSLDHHLNDPVKRERLTWTQRLKICLGAAKGLDYLHSGHGMDRVIHRDVKSGNILLDKNMEAKLCDFGLSKQNATISQQTQIYTKAAGTMFYLDPVYLESGILSKESDVYSFGVVLFEMLCGTLAYNPITFKDGSPQYLIILVRRYYNKEPKKLIDPDIRDEVDSKCFHTFKELAFQCINLKSAERPTMDTIIDVLEDAIEFQEHKV